MTRFGSNTLKLLSIDCLANTKDVRLYSSVRKSLEGLFDLWLVPTLPWTGCNDD